MTLFCGEFVHLLAFWQLDMVLVNAVEQADGLLYRGRLGDDEGALAALVAEGAAGKVLAYEVEDAAEGVALIEGAVGRRYEEEEHAALLQHDLLAT